MHNSILRIYSTFVVALAALIAVSLNAAFAQDGMMPPDDDMHSHDGEMHGEGGDRPPGEGEEQDSVKKIRQTQPLESYFFNDSVRARDNFIWSIDRDYNRVKVGSIDTTLNNWRIDYDYQKSGVGDMSLGGLGQASQAISFYDRANYTDNKFAQGFDSYIFTMENTPFYNVKKPITVFSYLESGQTTYRETNFGIMHAQNINPSTGFAVDYKSRSTKGQYYYQDTKNHNLAVTAYHTGKRYSVHAGYINNDIKAEENGGIVGIWAIRDSIFEMPNGVPTTLGYAEAYNRYRNNNFFVKQVYGVPLEPTDFTDFTIADKTAIYIGHTFEYNRWSKRYTDNNVSYTNALASVDENGNYVSETLNYYENWFINQDSSRDSIFEGCVSNRFYIQAQPWSRDAVIATIDGGVGMDNYTYSQFDLSSYVSGKYNVERLTSYLIYGSVGGSFKRYFSWNGEVEVHPAGYRMGDTRVEANALMQAFMRDKPLIVSGKFIHELRTPSYWQQNLFSNHYVFDTPLDKENITKAELTLRIPNFNLELTAKEVMIDKMVYYDENANVAQASGMTSVTSVYLRKNFKWGGLNLDHRLLAQWSTDQVVAPVPDYSIYLSYYYEFWVERLRVLRLQIGVDCRYTSRYYMPSYNPALSAFYNQRTDEIGDYPYTDVYLGAKWKRMRILVKYQHINQYVFGNDEYFTVAGYPQNPGALKIGFSWAFYD